MNTLATPADFESSAPALGAAVSTAVSAAAKPASGTRLRVLVVSAELPMYRRGLAAVLAADASFWFLGESVDSTEAVRDVLLHRPEVVLIDAALALQAQASGRSLITELRSLHRARFVLLQPAPGADALQQAQALGAHDVLGKKASALELVQALHRAHREPLPGPLAAAAAAGSAEAGAGRLASPGPTAIGEDLTRRESELLGLMARGLGNQDIATQLAISVPTVKFHVTNVLSKLHADNRTAAVLTALRQKLVTLD